MKKLTLFLITLAVCLGQAIAPAPTTYSSLPTASTVPNQLRTVTDCSTSACTAGGGSIRAVVQSTGSAWAVVGGGTVTVDAPYTIISGTKYLAPSSFAATVLAGTFSWVNQNSATVNTESSGVVRVDKAASASSGGFSIRDVALSSNTTLTAAVSCAGIYDSGSGDSTQCAVGIRESSTGKLVLFRTSPNNAISGITLDVSCFNSATSYNSNPVHSSSPYAMTRYFYKIEVTGSAINMSISPDGSPNSWMLLYTSGLTAGGCFTTAPDRWFFGVQPNVGSPSQIRVESWSIV